MPAPTTSTSTSAATGVPASLTCSPGRCGCGRAGVALYRPVSILCSWRSWTGSGRRSPCPTRCRSRTGCRRSATSTRTSTRWRSSCSGRGCGRWRAGSRRSPRHDDFVEYEFLDQSIIVLRDRRPWRCGRSRTSAATAASRSSRAAGRAGAGSPARSTGGATASTARNTHVTQRQDVRGAQPRAGGHRPHAGALRGVGRVRVDQPRRRRATVAAVHRAVRLDRRRVEDGVAAGREVVRVPAPGELEARAGGVRRAVPRGGDAPGARHPGTVAAPRRRAPSTRSGSSTRRSTTST